MQRPRTILTEHLSGLPEHPPLPEAVVAGVTYYYNGSEWSTSPEGGSTNIKETYTGTLTDLGDDFVTSIINHYGEYDAKRFYDDMVAGNVSAKVQVNLGGITPVLLIYPIEYDTGIDPPNTYYLAEFLYYENPPSVFKAAGFQLTIGYSDGEPWAFVSNPCGTINDTSFAVDPSQATYTLTLYWHEMPEE